MGGVKVIAALVVLVAGALAGHVLGAQGAPDEKDAGALRRAVSLAAYPRAFAEAFDDAWADGYLAGGADGVAAGQAAGRRAGRAEARRRAAAVAPARSDENEGTLPPASTTQPEGGQVLVVGDSLEVLTSPYDVFASSFVPSHDVVVFDAGTNDSPLYPQILEGRLAAVADAVGDRCSEL